MTLLFNKMSHFLLLLLLLVTTDAAFECPLDCECNQVSNLIKCKSLAGFKEIDKTIPIQMLDLSNIGLTKIPSQLENIRNITELNLSNNRLAEINKLSKRIKVLNLSNNKITSGKLSKIPPYIENLNLTYNEITYLPLNLMKLKNLKALELAGNPINCTCDTLHIRNWLTTRHVWSDQHIKCNAPFQFKGRPWLQVKQSDVCQFVHEHKSKKSEINWDDYEEENDLMMGDQAHEEKNDQEDEDEIEQGFLPVAEKLKAEPMMSSTISISEGSGDDSIDPVKHVEAELEIAEGSGTNSLVDPTNAELMNETDDDYEDGSGSGAGMAFIPKIASSTVEPSSTTSFEVTEDYDEDSDEPPLDPPKFNLGIFGNGLETSTADNSDMLAPIKVDPDEVGVVAEGEKSEEASDKAGTDNQSTYILLGIVGILLVTLIIVVACKRKSSNRNRRGKNDLENGKELTEMDKKLLGKPVEKNGHHENVPLMGDRDKTDFAKIINGDDNKYAPVKPERTSLEKAPMQSFKPDKTKSQNSLYENVPQENNNVPLQNGNGIAKPKDEPTGVHQNHVPSDPNDEVFLPPVTTVPSTGPKRYSPIYAPTSPKSDRYSPVYSPETGRVKIKLTETPKPKTPILVNRSRSRAGEFVTTPEINQKF